MSDDHFGSREEMIARYRALQSAIDAKTEECERLRSALRQLADNKLSDENCASVEVAGRRVANIARDALSAARKP